MRKPVVFVAAALSAALLASCGTPPAKPAAPEKAESAAPAVQSQRPTPSPTPTPEPTALKPGTNHNQAASAYAYDAKDVQAWLKEGSKAPNYPDKKIAFLTFDDGPNNVVTPGDLAVLKEKDAHATFYYVTKGIGSVKPDIIKQTIANGNAINVHSASHNYNFLYPKGHGNSANIVSDHTKALEQIQGVVGADFMAHGFRYPGGHMSWKDLGPADQELADKGFYWIDWNAMTGDAEPASRRPTTAQGMVNMVAKEAAGSNNNVVVILMHDAEDKKTTTAALPGVIDWLRSNGYELGVIN